MSEPVQSQSPPELVLVGASKDIDPAEFVEVEQINDSQSQQGQGQDSTNKDDSAQSQFVAHMATYPAVAAVVGFAASFPVIKIFASNAVPLVMNYQRRRREAGRPKGPITRIVVRADKLGDRLLDTVDRRYPYLKVAQPEEMYQQVVQEPVRRVQQRAKTAASTARSATQRGVIAPTKATVHSARTQYSKVYDNNGRPLVRSQLDPVLAPLNGRLEQVIINHIPDCVVPDTMGVTNEVSRTMRLGVAAARTASPELQRRARVVYTIPIRARRHTNSAYQIRYRKHARGKENSRRAATFAVLGTGIQLAREGTSRLRHRDSQLAGGQSKAATTEKEAESNINSGSADLGIQASSPHAQNPPPTPPRALQGLTGESAPSQNAFTPASKSKGKGITQRD